MLALWKTCVYPRAKGAETVRTNSPLRDFINICAQLCPQLSTVFTQIVIYDFFFVYKALGVAMKLSTATTTTSEIYKIST